jgi:hypothetical protein
MSFEIHDVAAANLVSTEFDQAIRRRLCARRFDVDDHEFQILEQARVTIVGEQFDSVVTDLETTIVSDEIRDE